MKQKQSYSPVPRLDLAPRKLEKLSLHNLSDYLHLLYWSLFFPQALRSYLYTWGNKSTSEKQMNWHKRWNWLHESHVERQLVLQGLALIVILSLIPRVIFTSIDAIYDGIFVLYGVGVSILLGLLFGLELFRNYSLSSRIISAVVVGVAFALTYSTLGIPLMLIAKIVSLILIRLSANILDANIANILEENIVSGMLFGGIFGVALNLGLTSVIRIDPVLKLSISYSVKWGVLLGLSMSILKGYWTNVNSSITSGLLFSFVFFVAFTLASILTSLRLENWLLYLLLSLKLPQHRLRCFPHVTPLPIPHLTSRLKNWLRQDWDTGLYNANQLLEFSLQINPVIDAISQVLCEIPENQLIPCISKLAENPYDWQLLNLVSRKLKTKAEILNFDDLNNPLNDTAKAAISVYGFYCLGRTAELKLTSKSLNTGYLLETIKAFDKVGFLPYGKEMFRIAQTLAAFADPSQLATLVFLQTPTMPTEAVLHLVTWEAIACLYRVLDDFRNIQGSDSPSVRVSALKRAIAELEEVRDKINTLPQAEKILIEYIALTWYESLLRADSKAEAISITEPVRNPYVIGDPVEGTLFIGRNDIIQQLKQLWCLDHQLQSVVLFGHRRMGKTSILKNIGNCLDSRVKVAYVNLLIVESAQLGVAEVLLAISYEISKAVEIPLPPKTDLLNFPIHTFKQYLQQIIANLDGGLIIALDEFEKIEKLIDSGKISHDFMGYLRGMVQMSSKIAFVFAGLHTLEEMTADYFQPFFASVIPIHVGFLEYSDTRKILSNPEETFSLVYKPETLKHIYVLTSGQPYLVQLTGFGLVRRFNDLFSKRGLPAETEFSIKDVEAVINDPEFFKRGRYYFDGVWGQAARGASGQQMILRSIAPYPEGLSINAIAQSTAIDEATVVEALNTLKRHDVVRETDGRWHIIVELFRRWVLDL